MKQTEIGLIPDDWEVKKLGDITTHVDYRGKTPKKTNMGIQLITAKNIRMGYIDYKNNQEFVSPTDYSEVMKRGLPQKGDVLITTEAPAGNVAQIDNENIALAQRVIKYRGNETLNNDYLCHYFLSDCFQNLLRAMNTGGTVQGIKGSLLHTLPVIVPPLPEQQRIAKALSDVDALITTTEKLIQKKKNIKQGTMQNLLTGKKRLPGFAKSTNYKQSELGPIPEDWEVKNIKELGVFISGSGFPLIEQGRKNEKYPFFKVSDFNNLGNENKLISANNYVSETVASKLCCKIVKKNSIVFAKIGAAIMLERKRITAHDCCIDNNMMAFTVNSDNDFNYLCYYFQQIPFASLSSSTALPSLSSKIIGNQLISVPSKEEQTAIANVLSSMDNEIETLNTKLEKYRNIKTAMMQQLLTGKIRLKGEKGGNQ